MASAYWDDVTRLELPRVGQLPDARNFTRT
jgi:hypothetical protein